MVAADVPSEVSFAADSYHGVGEIDMALKRAREYYVLGVGSDHGFNAWDKPRGVGGTAATMRPS